MRRKYLFAIVYGLILTIFTIYMLFDTFLIGRVYEVINTDDNEILYETGSVVSNETEYEDDNIKIKITEYRENDTEIYVADVQIKDASLLKTAFANNLYGKNITAKTSSIAESVNAILAINGNRISERSVSDIVYIGY